MLKLSLESPTQLKLPLNTTLLHRLPPSLAKVPLLVTLVNLMVIKIQTVEEIEEMIVRKGNKTAKMKGQIVEKIAVMRRWKENRTARMKGWIVEKTVRMRRWRENRIVKMKG